jgi:hypothetical protein
MTTQVVLYCKESAEQNCHLDANDVIALNNVAGEQLFVDMGL